MVSPIFRFLAAEIDKKGGSGMEIGHRIGYDDANECFCRVDCIRCGLGAINVHMLRLGSTVACKSGRDRVKRPASIFNDARHMGVFRHVVLSTHV